jgi:hypothetical protein
MSVRDIKFMQHEIIMEANKYKSAANYFLKNTLVPDPETQYTCERIARLSCSF